MTKNYSYYVILNVLISGILIIPYFLEALSPKARDKAKPGPQLFLPGAQTRIGPTNLSFEN
jgi:hypothetical protein